MKTKMKTIALSAVFSAALFTGCKKDKDPIPDPPPPVNEEEIITTFTLYFTDSANTSNVVSAAFRDPDGDGGNPYTEFDTIKLMPNKTYYAQVIILNETKSPADSISNEVEEEANDHLFIYTSIGTNTTITITDTDANTPPLSLGLASKWKTGSAAMGTTRIVLKHQPGMKDGTAAPGSTDIDLLFHTKIQ